MRRLGLFVWVCSGVLVGCSDDGFSPEAESTGGMGDPFVTSLPPTSSDPAGSMQGTEGDTADPEPASTGSDDDIPPGGESTGMGVGDSSGGPGPEVAMPVEGELVISEIMQNPAALDDADGEWFEVYNPSPTVTYELQDCTVEGAAQDTPFVIDVSLQVAPDSRLVFATTSALDQGFVPDFSWDSATFQLNNTTDEVRIVCAGVTIDEVIYDNGMTFPDPTGASMSLDPAAHDPIANDDGTNWCEATTDYNGDLGTPGAPNDPCGA